MYDPQLGRWNSIDPRPNYSESLYAGMRDNPISFNDPLGDTIVVNYRKGFLGLGGKASAVYNEGKLTNKDGTALKGKAHGFLKQATKALDNARAGGQAGAKLVGDLEKGASFTISKTTGGNNTDPNGSGVNWNPSDTKPQQPNADGSTGRAAWVGLVHELGHQWDEQNNGNANTSTTWYVASNGQAVSNSDKIATWWENQVRAENQMPLREFYSFLDPGGGAAWTPDPAGGRILDAGTRTSSVVDASGNIYPGSALPSGVTPFNY